MTDRTELRRLMVDSNVASPGPWRRIGQRVDDRDRFEVGSFICEQDAKLIVAAVNALPDLLDQLDAAEAALARVRELHWESHGSLSALYPNPICECGKDYPCPTIRALGGEQS